MVEYLACSSVWNSCTWKKKTIRDLKYVSFFPPPPLQPNTTPKWIGKTLTILNPLRTNPLRTWGYPCSQFPYFPPIALKNRRVGWKILNRFLFNGSVVETNRQGGTTQLGTGPGLTHVFLTTAHVDWVAIDLSKSRVGLGHGRSRTNNSSTYTHGSCLFQNYLSTLERYINVYIYICIHTVYIHIYAYVLELHLFKTCIEALRLGHTWHLNVSVKAVHDPVTRSNPHFTSSPAPIPGLPFTQKQIFPTNWSIIYSIIKFVKWSK